MHGPRVECGFPSSNSGTRVALSKFSNSGTWKTQHMCTGRLCLLAMSQALILIRVLHFASSQTLELGKRNIYAQIGLLCWRSPKSKLRQVHQASTNIFDGPFGNADWQTAQIRRWNVARLPKPPAMTTFFVAYMFQF